MNGRRRWRPWLVGLVTLLALAVVAAGVAVMQNDYDLGLTVKSYPDATHGMVQKNIEDSTLRTSLTAIFNPRGLFAPGVLADQETFLVESTRACQS